ncbi:MAG: hypothetical protein ACRDMZ_09915, partial [Solirubrobacteraceae bacterium]
MASAYDRLAGRLLDLVAARVEASEPAKIERGRVLQASPLVVDLGDDVLIEEGDPDVEFDRAVLAERPVVGDAVRVHFDGEDWIVSGVIEAGED